MWATARLLYGLSGALWLAIGVLTPPLLDRQIGPPIVFVSTRTDTALFGTDPRALMATNTDLVTLRGIVVRALSALLVGAGVLVVGMAWFALADRTVWAVALLTIVGLGVIPYWWIALAPYRAAGISLQLSDIPPFMWVPAVLMPVASMLAWIHLARP